MDFEKIKQMREYCDELARLNDTLDKELERAKDELWETRVREIAVSELARSAEESYLRSAGIVKSFHS